MQEDTLYKLTGLMSLGFGAYCLLMAALAIAFEVVEPPTIFALLFMIIGILYCIAGISILRKGRFGFIVFFGFFGFGPWWGSGIPYYIWPMIIMPIVIIVLMAAVFLRQFSDYY